MANEHGTDCLRIVKAEEEKDHGKCMSSCTEDENLNLNSKVTGVAFNCPSADCICDGRVPVGRLDE